MYPGVSWGILGCPGVIRLTRSLIKVTVTPKWYETLSYFKMHPHTEFGMPISNDIGDIALTRKRN